MSKSTNTSRDYAGSVNGTTTTTTNRKENTMNTTRSTIVEKILSNNAEGYRPSDHSEAVEMFFQKVFGDLAREVSDQEMIAEMISKNPRQTEIKHYLIYTATAEVKDEQTGEVRTVAILCPPVENDRMRDAVEYRFSLCPYIGSESSSGKIEKAATFSLVASSEDRKVLAKDPFFAAKLYHLIKGLGYNLIGGTGLNRGTFYAVQWKNHGLHFAHEAIGYLSLPFTGAGLTPDGKPLVFEKASVLVVSRNEMRKSGLASDGGGFAFTDLGQYRMAVGSGIAKGAVMGFKRAKKIGLLIPEEWEVFDFVISEDDVKVGSVKPGAYNKSTVLITFDNIYTVRGQQVGLGFEFWQNIAEDEEVHDLISKVVMGKEMPSPVDMLAGIETKRRLKSVVEGEEYEPLDINIKLLEAYFAFGPQYRWVNDKLKALAVNYLMTQSWPGTSYHLVMVITREAAERGAKHYWHTEVPGEAKVVGGKYPIVAGVMQLAGDGKVGPFVILDEDTAAKFNVDSDGDCMFLLRSELSDLLLSKNLIDPARDIKIDKGSLERRTYQVTMENMVRQAVHIYTTSASVGSQTNMLYRVLVANRYLDAGIDPQPVLEPIELMLKGAKHKTEVALSSAMRKFYEIVDVKTLIDLVPMVWGRAAKADMLREFNAFDSDFGLKELAEQKVKEPIGYMDQIWNLAIDRALVECEKLEAMVQPLSSFSEKVGMPNVDVNDPEVAKGMDMEIKELRGLAASYAQIGPDGLLSGRGSEMVRVVSSAAGHFTLAARQAFTEEYLRKTQSKTGSFAVHINNGSMCAVMGNELQYTTPESPYRMVRVYDSGKGAMIMNTENCARLQKDGDILHVGDRVFNYGEGYNGEGLDQYEINAVVPYVRRSKDTGKVVFSTGCWVLLKAQQ